MANNINVTQGSGTTMATNDIGGVHHQRIIEKLGPEDKTGVRKTAVVAASTSGSNNVIVAAVPGKQLCLLSGILSAAGQVNAKFQSNQSTDKGGLLYMDTRGGAIIPFQATGHFETTAGEALTLNLSAAVAVGGWITYCEI